MLSKIYIDERVVDSTVVHEITAMLKIPVETVSSPTAVYQWIAGQADPISAGKEILFLTENKGPFIRKCPGTQFYTCCGYQILHIGTFCTMDCAYCILQAYFHPPVLQYFVNQDRLQAELKDLFSKNETTRIGTGEFTDSLIWEKWTTLSDMLVPLFASQDRAVLELKTKTTLTKKIERFDHNRKTILSWSLNTPAIIATEERRTPSLKERIAAAKRAQDMGFPLAFHFDPVVVYDGCEEAYRAVVDLLFQSVSPENVAYISIGTFRYMPDLAGIIQTRFPDSRILNGEFIAGIDNKMRYFKPIRMGIYRVIIEAIRAVSPEVFIYFCMEDDEVWKHCIGFLPQEHGGLSTMLDKRVQKICHLKS